MRASSAFDSRERIRSVAAIVSIGVIVLVSACRVLISEPLQVERPLLKLSAAASGPTTAATAWFDLALLSAAALGAWTHRTRPPLYVLIALGLVAVGAAASYPAASNKRIAIVGAVDLLSMAVAGFTLARLLSTAARRRLVVVIVVAVGSLFAAKCFYQRFVEYPQTIRYFQLHKDEILRRSGLSADDHRVLLFEARMRSMDVTGYFALSNYAAAVLVLMTVAAVGLGTDNVRLANPQAFATGVIILALAGLMAAAVVLTSSRGGLAALVVAMALLAVAATAGRLLMRFRKQCIAVVVAVIVLGGAAVVGYGIRCGRLPTTTLLYRWHYWTGAAEILRDHPFGVGMRNFGIFYPAYKRPYMPEEPENPHCFLVQAAVELGPIGAVGLVMLLAVVMLQATRPQVPPCRPVELHASQARWFLPTVLVLAMLVVALRAAVLGTYALQAWVMELFAPAVVLVLLCMLACVTGERLGTVASVRPSLLAVALPCGLAGFLLQGTIESTLFEPGPGTMFWLLAGLAMAYRAGSSTAAQPVPAGRPPRHRGELGWTAALTVAVFAVLVWIVVPVVRSQRYFWSGAGQFDLAAEADPLEPAAALEDAKVSWALWVRGHRTDATMGRSALEKMRRAVARNPQSAEPWRLLAILQAEMKHPAAAAAAEQALKRDPTRPQLCIEMADLMYGLGKLHRARELYQQALDIDKAYRDFVRREGISSTPILEARLREHAKQRLSQLRRSGL